MWRLYVGIAFPACCLGFAIGVISMDTAHSSSVTADLVPTQGSGLVVAASHVFNEKKKVWERLTVEQLERLQCQK